MRARSILAALATSATLLCFASAAKAGPAACADALLSAYLTPGFTCSTQNAVLSNFSLSSSATGGAAALTGADIEFQSDVSDSGPGFDYFTLKAPSGSWDVTAGQTIDATVDYTWTPHHPTFGYGWVLSTPLGRSGDGSSGFTFTVTAPGDVPQVSQGGCPQTSPCDIAYTGFTQPWPRYDVSSAFSLNGGQSGAASMGGVLELLIGVPEPATWAMLSTGFASLGATLRFRRSAKRAL